MPITGRISKTEVQHWMTSFLINRALGLFPMRLMTLPVLLHVNIDFLPR